MSKRARLAALTFALLGVASEVRASGALPANPRYVLQQVGERLGLATRAVVALVQDGQGFIWIGTQDGLFRFDGVRITEFGHAQGLPNSSIVQLTLGPDSEVWASTHGGIAYFDGVRFNPVFVDTRDEPSIHRVPQQHIAVDRERSLYVASSIGLLKLDGTDRSQLTLWSRDQGLPATHAEAVHVASDGAVWVGSAGQVALLDRATHKFVLQPLPPESTDLEVKAILTSTDGTVWVRTASYLARRDPGAEGFVHDSEGVAIASMYGIPSLDRSGDILVPTVDGLFYKAEGRWESVSERNGLLISLVFAALQDHEGALWIGLGGAGVSRWPGRKQWSAWTTAEGLPDNVAWSAARDSSGRLWVGTNRGLGVWDHKRARWLYAEPDAVILDLVLGPDNWIWCATTDGQVMRINPRTLVAEPVTLPPGRERDRVKLARGPDGAVWIGSYDYLLVARWRSGQVVLDEVRLPDEVKGRTLAVAVTNNGVVWTGGAKGLARFDGKAWQVVSRADGLRTDFVYYITARSDNEAWVAYRDYVGLSRVRLTDDGPQIRTYWRSDGLPSDTVYLVGVDALGRVWAGGNAGIAAFSEIDSLRIFNRGNGLIWDDLNSDSLLAEPDGSFFVGTSRGLAHYEPTPQETPEPPPKVAITSVIIGGHERLGQDGIEVGWKARSFSVKFAGATFRSPAAVRFRYRLLGLDPAFSETTLRELSYPALPAGDYRFEVSCRSAAGIWSEEPDSFSFSVISPWWRRWWARGAMTLAVVLILLGVIKLRTAKLQEDRERLERAVAERSAELAEANKELEELSFTDLLTEARNRRFFMTVVPDEVARVARRFDKETGPEPLHDNRGVLFMLVDIDWFKKVNDLHGHLAGDMVLAQVATRLRAAIRATDLLVRWGGEEFMIVCWDSDPAAAQEVARRVLQCVGTEPFDLGNGKTMRRTCSAGWAALPWSIGTGPTISHETVIEIADKALYLAKEAGRNRAVGVMALRPVLEEREIVDLLEQPLAEAEGKSVQLVRETGPTAADASE